MAVSTALYQILLVKRSHFKLRKINPIGYLTLKRFKTVYPLETLVKMSFSYHSI